MHVRSHICSPGENVQHFQSCRETESKPDWWARVKHSDQLTGLVSVAKPDDRRIDSGGTPQERNPVEVRGQDLEQDTETETHTSESLTMWLRQVQQRRGEGQRKALSCLILNKSAREDTVRATDGMEKIATNAMTKE